MQKPNHDIIVRLDRPFPAFHLNIDLVLPGTGVTALFGHSGSGKTTCLRCIAGLEKAETGYISIKDDCWQDSDRSFFLPPHKRPLGYVFQETNLFSHLSVLDNLRYGMKRIPAKERRVELHQACSLLGIEHLLQRQPQHLSGGERQRVGIVRALLTSPRLLILDEPLASLDIKRRNEILPYLERLHTELDIPVLYVSHSPNEVARLAHHLVLLEEGRVLASGPISEMLARLDLPTAQDEAAGVTIDGRSVAHDDRYGLLTLQLPNSQHVLRVPHDARSDGEPLRLKILARDVSLTLHRVQDSTIVNILPARVIEYTTTANKSQVMIRLDVEGTPLLARITRYSFDQLNLQEGQSVWAQIKAVALLA